MYSIGHVIVGTHVTWSPEGSNAVAEAYVADDPTSLLQEGETIDDLMASAAQGELDWLDCFEERDGWTKEYHGGGNSTVAWVGEELMRFDDTDHIPLDKMMRCGMQQIEGSQKWCDAKHKYDSLPSAVRDVLPPFGVYIVWSSS